MNELARVINNIGSITTNIGSLVGIGLCILFCLAFFNVGNRYDVKKNRGTFEYGGLIIVMFVIGLVLLGASA